ncbi:uncharacterized protein LOC124356130 [Homalodisca vitripennis]|uniref:uncharacterized protein LOC124356130 n=1 Tax=Homalodisca vitripennis TaxID=197043 RepID=UPI001EEAF06E|nr:uncharacterized protein LOC124356130 [Homalodisca vitripennis]
MIIKKRFIIALELFLCSALMEDYSHLHMYDGSDFLVVVSSSLFVDKSLFIKHFLDNTKTGDGILILTPGKFGKTTSLNMIKRFLSINIDEKGNVKELEETSNYNVFRNNNLDAYKLNGFFKKYFGKYPVISIDYKALSETSSYDEFIETLKLLFFKTYRDHAYLLYDSNQWTMKNENDGLTREKLKLYMSKMTIEKLNLSDIMTGFNFLCQVLNERFGRGVIVLIDNFDAFVESPLFSRNPNISSVFKDVNSDLLRCDSVERSLIMGRGCESGSSPEIFLPANIRTTTQAWPYFGLSIAELEELLRHVVRRPEAREKAMNKILHRDSFGNTRSCTVAADNDKPVAKQMCCFESLMEYFKHEEANDYPAYEEYDFK